jgi:hypothetical protein
MLSDGRMGDIVRGWNRGRPCPSAPNAAVLRVRVVPVQSSPVDCETRARKWRLTDWDGWPSSVVAYKS